jgi:hypothetical protein
VVRMIVCSVRTVINNDGKFIVDVCLSTLTFSERDEGIKIDTVLNIRSCFARGMLKMFRGLIDI